MDIICVIVIVLIIIAIVCIYKNSCSSKEGMGGFGATSALAMYNRVGYSDPGNCKYGGAYCGGTFLDHRVIT